jgi:YD repeat-containing protein
LQPWNSAQPFAILNWSCSVHDLSASISGLGDVVESKSIDASGKSVRTLYDGLGRELETYDQAGNKSFRTFSPAGPVLSARGPNGVGYDLVYDQLGRTISRTETGGDVNSTTYDREGNVLSLTDPKGNVTSMTYDAQNRIKTKRDRVNGIITYNYNSTHLISIVDGVNPTTTYEYNARGDKIK